MYFCEYNWARGQHGSSTPRLRRNNNGGCVKRPRSASLSYVRRYKMIEGGIEHSGYVDVKQPAKTKGRKLKSWKKKWVVVHEMSIRSAGRSAAKVDVYANEKTSIDSPADKLTFILEFVTEVRSAKSKTHTHAFEIVEKDPVLLFAGNSELESQMWISVFRNIFFRDQDQEDIFPVVIIRNDHTIRLGLHGDYTMTINPEVIAISSEVQNSYEWSLHTLKRFHLEKDSESPETEILSIECGPKSECGEAKFQFRAKRVTDILAAIKKNIFLALNKKQIDKTSVSSDKSTYIVSQGIDNERQRTMSSNTREERFKTLLETSSHSPDNNTNEGAEDDKTPDNVSNASSTEVTRKKRQSVSFDKNVINESEEPIDSLLSHTEPCPQEESESEYNVVDHSHHVSEQSFGNIISVITVAKPGYQTKVLLDENGYSHVDFKNSKPVITEDKSRSLSNMSSRSSVSGRSESVGSRDSGILYSKADKSENKSAPSSKRSTNSFDSAVSTSSTTVGQPNAIDVVNDKHTLTVEIHEVEVTGEELMSNNNSTLKPVFNTNDDGVYQDVSLDEAKLHENEPMQIQADSTKPRLKKCNSTGDCKENEYEDLDNYRKGKKNLIKHLGMDPQVDPNSVPPALPERPLSYKIKRKFANNDKKLFTLHFVRHRSKKNKEKAVSISSSSSDSESESVKGGGKPNISLKVWPLGNKSIIAGNDDLYQPIAIERFLQDNDGMTLPQKRERSSSLNLNNVSAMKRPSISSERVHFSNVERRNVILKHNRNVSMQMDILGRKSDPDFETVATDVKDKFNMTAQPAFALSSKGSCSVEMNNDGTKDDSFKSFEDEPIYAEVETPTRLKSDANVENPFPNLDASIWKPTWSDDTINATDVTDELNGTKYENDDSMTSLINDGNGDALNQGFCNDDVNRDLTKCDNESVLIDISTSEGLENQSSAKTAIDIFNMGVGPMLLESPPMTPMNANTSTMNCSVKFVDIFHLGVGGSANESMYTNTAQSAISSVITTTDTDTPSNNECIYMDMSSCKNESIYVMPSTLRK